MIIRRVAPTIALLRAVYTRRAECIELDMGLHQRLSAETRLGLEGGVKREERGETGGNHDQHEQEEELKMTLLLNHSLVGEAYMAQ